MPNWRGRKPVTGPYLTRSVHGIAKRDHVIIAERALGRPLPEGVEVHHVDGDGHNNANRNLVICQDTAYHQLLHKRQRVLEAGGNPNADYLCSACRRPRPKEMFAVRKSGAHAGKPISFCTPCNRARRKAWGESVKYNSRQTAKVGAA